MKGTRLAAMACAATLATGCSAIDGLLAGGGPGGGTPGGTAGPKAQVAAPKALVPEKKAKEIVFGYANLRNTAAGLYETEHLANVEGGSLLETHAAELKILKRKKREPAKVSGYGADVMTPKNSGYPKWFVGMTHDEADPSRRQLVVFVADKPGDGRPVRGVLSAELDWSALQRLPGTIREAEFGDELPPGDQSVAVAPKDLANTHVAAVRDPRGAQAALFDVPAPVAGVAKRVSLWKRYFTSAGWTGTSSAKPSPHPTYALRMSNGGALVLYGVDVEHRYRNSGGGSPREGLVGGRWGNVFPALIGRSAVRERLTGVERTEFAAYVPPKGRGKLIIMGSRWSPVKAEGK